MIDTDTILATPMQQNDAHAATVGEYLQRLLSKIWEEGEGFSGKRPFGNSGWTYEVYTALGKAGIITATFDEDGFLEDVDNRKGDEIISKAIKGIFQ